MTSQHTYPPSPPCPRTALRKNRPLVLRSNSGTTLSPPAPKPNAAPKPGPKGQHRQEFRMVYHRKNGFTSELVEH